MSMYLDYCKERLGQETFEVPGKGFAIYSFTPSNECYIEEIYVVPSERKSMVASEMADEIVKIAKERECKTLLGSVTPSANGATTSLKVLLGYGFKIFSSKENYILFYKEV